MNINYRIAFAFILGVIARILTNPWILGYSNENYSIHKNKIYDAIFFGCLVGILQIFINIDTLSIHELMTWLILLSSIFFIIKYMINNQVYIDELHLLLKIKENYGEINRLSEILSNDNKLSVNIKKFIDNEINNNNDAIKIINNFIKS